MACLHMLHPAFHRERNMGKNLRDARIAVVGASGDIGRAIAVSLMQAGAEVLAQGRRFDRLWHDTSAMCRHAPTFLTIDLTDLAAVKHAVEKIAAKPKLDVLILTAGMYRRSQDPEVLRQQMDANVIGPYALIMGLLPLLVDSKGHIICINSSQALRASAEVGQYAATKHAMKALIDSVRDEVNGKGVRVTSIYLGRTAGRTQRQLFATEGRQYQPTQLIQPADVAQMIAAILQMERTAEITDINIRPSLRP
jgi:NADP-dependent 3-hydroxy acid dehydrogenase YdfG